MLEMQQVSYSYGAVRALQEVSISAQSGALVAVLGANGAGKSTILKVISGLIRPAGGRVVLDGTDITGTGPDRRLGAGIALCPEGRRIFPNFTVLDNLRVGGHLLGSDELTRRVDEALDLFPVLRQRASQPAGSLSGGEQQMVAIGRALMTGPKLLLLDEPSLGLAPIITRQVFDTVDRVRQGGMTVILVEQNRMALRYADYAYVLSRGQVQLEGPAAEVRDDEGLRRAYLGG